jgi:hypothetical protein
LSESFSSPYQGLFIDFGFSWQMSYDKEGKVIPLSWEDIEGRNGETAWILISDAQTKMLHGDARVSKASPIKYLESFLQNIHQMCKINLLFWIKVVNCIGIELS